jgi:hypothetical protein
MPSPRDPTHRHTGRHRGIAFMQGNMCVLEPSQRLTLLHLDLKVHALRVGLPSEMWRGYVDRRIRGSPRPAALSTSTSRSLSSSHILATMQALSFRTARVATHATKSTKKVSGTERLGGSSSPSRPSDAPSLGNLMP